VPRNEKKISGFREVIADGGVEALAGFVGEMERVGDIFAGCFFKTAAHQDGEGEDLAAIEAAGIADHQVEAQSDEFPKGKRAIEFLRDEASCFFAPENHRSGSRSSQNHLASRH